tara:strand:+ start:460 stop:945 length:486 start_codon:yes stop_codon:yes gene_type:complete
MPSFDVVCRTNLAELDNAVNGVGREVRQRFDLKGTDCHLERSGDNLIINADNDMLLRQMHDLIITYCGKRRVDIKALDFKKPEIATKGTLRQEVAIRQGIEDSMCRQIVKKVKGKKLKVQVTIQGSELRVSGKKRDDLQETIKAIKDMNLDVPLQYINFRD